MASEPESDPALPGASGVPVKPESEVFDQQSVPALWLVDDDNDELAQRVDRLEADYQWVNDLALAGFMGTQWNFFAEELAKYGMAVIGGWMRNKLIFRRCQDRGFGGLPHLDRPFSDEEIEELTMETVSKALHHFRVDVLMKKKWDYRKGATLRTYFVGQCLIRFANIYRAWYGNEARRRQHSTSGDEIALSDFGKPSRGMSDKAIDFVTAKRILGDIKDERVVKALIWTADGKSQAEIAVELEVTEKTVERMLANERARVRRRETGWR